MPTTPRPPFDAVFVDLDGTLLNAETRVSDLSFSVLDEVARLGVRIVAATGRPVHSVRKLLSAATFPLAAITLNGTVVHTDLWAAEPHAVHPIDADVVRRMGHFLHSRAGIDNIAFDCVECWFAREQCDLTGLFEGMYDHPPRRLVLPWNENEQVLNIVLACAAERENLAQELGRHFGEHVATIVYHQWPMVEISNRWRSKGQALRELCAHWEIDPACTLAFGDGENDRDLMTAAGHAIAMANGRPEIRALAHRVAPANHEHGVALTLRDIFLQG